MRRAYKVALVSFVVALPLLMAPTGGIPSRPRFQSVGVNVAAPATGNLTASGTITAATVNATSALQIAGVPLVTGYSGATVRKTAAQTNLSSAGTIIPLSWDAEVTDTGNFHDNVTNNSRVTLPTQTGFAQCSLSFTGINPTTQATTQSSTAAWIGLNGAGAGGTVRATAFALAWDACNTTSCGAGSFPPTYRVNVVTPIMAVSGGDYAEAYVTFNGYSANTNSVSADSANSSALAQFSCWAVK